MTIALEFHGAARHVTGSKHLLDIDGLRVLLDCGMVQGPRKVSEALNRNLPFDARTIDMVVLSHAHIDHCGSLPKLVKDGFEGPIHCTEATADMLEMMLLDSAHIQAHDAKHLRKRGIDYEPVYTSDDVMKTLALVRGQPYHRTFAVHDKLNVEFLEAGHILGAAIVVLDVDDGHKQRRVVFTGDHGRKELPILRDPDPVPECDVLITESTYGDRLHDAKPDMMAELGRIVEEEARDGGRIVIPAFSVGRTQSVVMYLGQLIKERQLLPTPIYVDSPMSTRATKIMSRHKELFDEETLDLLHDGHRPFRYEDVHYVADVKESKELNNLRYGVIISASGMCEAGRILHHLRGSLHRHEDCVLLVGYQAAGTLGRKLRDGVDRVRIYGEEHEVRCKVRTMGGFSAHADYQELLDACRHLTGRCQQVFVVHGEDGPAETHADRLRAEGFQDVVVPSKGDRIEIR